LIPLCAAPAAMAVMPLRALLGVVLGVLCMAALVTGA
jgi:hypothetical protein